MNGQRIRFLRQTAALAASLLGLVLFACRPMPETLFIPQDSSPVWPSPPKTARIAYLGEIASSADLKASSGFFESLGGLFAGEEEPERLYGPRSLVCTDDGRRLWVADPGGRCVHGFDLESRSYTRLRRLGDSFLLSPVGLCLGPEGSVFLCDSESVTIHRFRADTGELIETFFLTDEIRRPAALAYVPARKQLIVADAGFHDLKILDARGRLTGRIGRRGVAAGEFNFPCGLVFHDNMLWVADCGNQRIQGLTLDGEVRTLFGKAGDAPGDMAFPKGIAFDSDGHVYVVDSRFENVQIFEPSGQLLLFFGHEGVGPGQFWLPSGIFIDKQDRVWVCDSYNSRIQVFQYAREVQSDLPK